MGQFMLTAAGQAIGVAGKHHMSQSDCGSAGMEPAASQEPADQSAPCLDDAPAQLKRAAGRYG
jgi:hypothetical protein